MIQKFNSINLLRTTFVQPLAFVFLLGLAPAHAEESYTGYEAIIQELSSSSTNTQSVIPDKDPFNVIKFHAGVSMISSQISLDLPGRLPKSKSMHGYEAQFGIDLFSQNWMAVGAVRSFDPENARATEIHLREFDLLVLYKTRLSRSVAEFNIGGGMASRYLDLTGDIPVGAKGSYTTPSTVITSGLGFYITPAISLGAQFSFRNPLISDTIDEGSLDGALHLGGHF